VRRRSLLLAGLGLPLAGYAQQGARMPVVGVLALGIEGRVERVREGLRSLGYQEGRNVHIEERTVDGRYAELAAAAREFVRMKVDVIVALGDSAAFAAREATTAIPVVTPPRIDPALVSRRLQLAKEAMPAHGLLGIVWNPDSRGSANSFAQTQQAVQALKVRLHAVEVRAVDELDRAFGALARSGVRMFVLMAGGMFDANRLRVLAAAARHRLPGVYPSRRWSEDGGLYSYGAPSFEAELRAASYVDRILKGAKSGELATEQPARMELVVNRKAARLLGATIPQAILLRADHVIE